MRICYLCPDLGISVDGHKGASSHIRGFVRALKKKGHDVVIASSNSSKDGAIEVPVLQMKEPAILSAIIKEDNPRAYRALRHIFYNVAVEEVLHRAVSLYEPSLVYERYSPFSFAGGAFCKRFDIPHILEVNAPLAEQGKVYRKQSLQEASELIEKTAFQNAGLIITLADELKEWVVSLGISDSKIHIRPCGVDSYLFNPVGESYRNRFNEGVILGFVGSLKPWHDIELLSNLFRILSKDPKYHLLVVGDGPLRKVVNSLAHELPGRVTCTGALDQEEVPKYIRAMDIALAPYPLMDLFYFSPLKAFEYMASGKAVIATGIGQLKQLIEPGVNGFLVPPGSIEDWVRIVNGLANDAVLRKRLGEAAAKSIQNCHTWDIRACAFEKIVESYFDSILIPNHSENIKRNDEKDNVPEPIRLY